MGEPCARQESVGLRGSLIGESRGYIVEKGEKIWQLLKKAGGSES